MKIISLGYGCQVKFNIDRLFKEEETNFFDWLITDFKSVLYILQNIHNKNLITSSNFTDQEVFKPGKSWFEPFHKIECVNFKMISVHDFPSNIHYMDYMNEFISKYKRRLTRLKNMISSCENIHMIHCLDHQFTDAYIITNDDIDNYKKYLRVINPNNNCFLHIVIPPKYNNIYFNHLIQDKVYVYYLNDTQQGNCDWANTNFNWNVIFDNIYSIG
jgi:hypothetical protein